MGGKGNINIYASTSTTFSEMKERAHTGKIQDKSKKYYPSRLHVYFCIMTP